MKRTLITGAALFLALALCACAGGGNPDTTPIPDTTSQTPGVSAATETQPPTENVSGEESPENVKITFITQEYYEGGDIVEIPYFEYDGAKNDVIDGINRLFNQGLQMRYEEFDANRSSYETWEIRTYPFTDERYVQVVITSILYSVYPDFQWSGTVESVNYDKWDNKWILFSDLGIEEDSIIAEVSRLYVLTNEGAVIEDDGVKITGFLLRSQDGQSGNFTEILLEIATASGDRIHISFCSYCPETGEFYMFDPSAVMPFGHNDMDRMDPPLYYDLFEAQTGGEPLANGVIYTGSLLESDHGDNMSTYEAASGLYYRVLHEDYEYSEENTVYIMCVDVMEIDGAECYLFEVSGPIFGNMAYAVNYDYDSQNIYEVSGGRSNLIGSILDLGSAKAFE